MNDAIASGGGYPDGAAGARQGGARAVQAQLAAAIGDVCRAAGEDIAPAPEGAGEGAEAPSLAPDATPLERLVALCEALLGADAMTSQGDAKGTHSKSVEF